MRKSTMFRFRTSRLAPLAAILVLCAGFVLAGCDSNDDEDESDYAVLKRQDWVVTSFTIDGQDRTTRLESEYSGGVTFSFSETQNTGERTFEIFANADSQADDVQVNGNIDIDGDDDILFFTPTFDNLDDQTVDEFDLDYIIEGASRVRLIATDDDGRDMRNFLLPNSNIGGSFPTIRFVIEPSV